MASLSHLEVRDTFAPNGPTVLAHITDLLVCVSDEPQPGVQNLRFEVALDHLAVACCTVRRVVRRVMDDGTWREYRITAQDERTGGDGARALVTAVDPLYDLAEAGLLTEVSAVGLVSYDIGLTQASITEILDTWVIGQLPSVYAHFARGTVEPTDLLDVTALRATHLEVLRAVAAAALDPATGLAAEYQVRQTSAAFYVDVVRQVAGSEPIADLRSRKNLLSTAVRRPTDRMATVLAGFGAEDGRGDETTIARAVWTLGTPSGLSYPITDPEGGPSPVLEDDQLNGWYVVPNNAAGALVQVTDTIAGAPAQVVLASAVTAGEEYEFRATSAGRLVTDLVSPSRRLQYGDRHAVLRRSSFHGVRNHVRNPYYRTWTNAANPPDGHTVTLSGGMQAAQNTDPLYTRYGPHSYRMYDNGALVSVGSFLTGTIYPRAVVGDADFSAKALIFLETFRQQVLLTIRLVNASTGFQVGVPVQWVPLDHPSPGTTPRVAAGQWVTAIIQGVDLTALNTAGVKLEVNAQVNSAVVGGSLNAFVDALMVGRGPTAPPIWFAFSGANPLHHEVNRALRVARDPVASYEIQVLDLTRLDASEYPYDALTSGATVRLTDADGTTVNRLLRVIARPVINWLQETETTLVLASQEQQLQDLVDLRGGGSVTALRG